MESRPEDGGFPHRGTVDIEHKEVNFRHDSFFFLTANRMMTLILNKSLCLLLDQYFSLIVWFGMGLGKNKGLYKVYIVLYFKSNQVD